MQRVGVLVHLLLVELRCIFLLYASILFLIRSTATSIILSLRSSNIHEWCGEPTCLASVQATVDCILRGVSYAMWSADTSYANHAVCTKFHVDNYLGHMNFIALCLLLLLTAYVVTMAFKRGVRSFCSGDYIAFTTMFVRNHTLVQILIKVGLAYMICLLLFGPLLILFIIPQDILDRTETTRGAILRLFVLECTPSYAATLLVAWHLKDSGKLPIDITHAFVEGVELRRTWVHFFTQTNWTFVEHFVSAVVKAKYGQTEDLQSLIMDPAIIDKVVEDCNPNKPPRRESVDNDSYTELIPPLSARSPGATSRHLE